MESFLLKRGVCDEEGTDVGVMAEEPLVCRQTTTCTIHSMQRVCKLEGEEDLKRGNASRAKITHLNDEAENNMCERANEGAVSRTLLLKERGELNVGCDEYENRNRELRKQVVEVGLECEVYRSKTKALESMLVQWERKAERLLEAKIDAEARALRAEQKAELAELQAKHAASRTEISEKRLEEAIWCSEAVCGRVEELRKLQARVLRRVVLHPKKCTAQWSGGAAQMFSNVRTLDRVCSPVSLGRCGEISAQGCGAERVEGNKAAQGKMVGRNGSDVEDEEGNAVASVKRLFVVSPHGVKQKGMRIGARKRPKQSAVSTTLGALDRNVECLRGLVEVKQKEVDRLYEELVAVTAQSNTFERWLLEERLKC